MTENELYIKGAAFYETKYGRRSAFKVEGRPHHSITFRVDGKITVKSHGKKLISDKGSITFIPKGAAYTSEVLEDVHIIVIHFDTDGEGLPTESTVIASEEHSLSPLSTLFVNLLFVFYFSFFCQGPITIHAPRVAFSNSSGMVTMPFSKASLMAIARRLQISMAAT